MTFRIPGLIAVAAAALSLAACATPLVQSPLTPPPGFAGPRIEDAPAPGMTGAFRACATCIAFAPCTHTCGMRRYRSSARIFSE